MEDKYLNCRAIPARLNGGRPSVAGCCTNNGDFVAFPAQDSSGGLPAAEVILKGEGWPMEQFQHHHWALIVSRVQRLGDPSGIGVGYHLCKLSTDGGPKIRGHDLYGQVNVG